jgi:hypothetical protein
MSMKNYERANELIDEAGDGDFEGPKPESLVKLAEAALGLQFPPTYRRFLLERGCGDIGGFEVYGLINENFENSSVPDGIWLTLNERQAGLYPAFVLIGDSGDGGYYAIDTTKTDSSKECPVVLLTSDGGVEPIAKDFGKYFLDAVKEALE